MQIGEKFSLAIHILLCIDYFGKHNKVTGDFIAGSAHTNPVTIRTIMGSLRRAGLIEVAPGTGGARLLKLPESISMLDVYRAVNPTKDGKLFKIHGNSEPRCPVGGHIESLLKPVFHDAQDALESSLGSTSLAGLAEKLKIH